jgi:hypothetical protein
VKQDKSAALTTAPVTAVKPPPAPPVIERIRNRDLPVPIINERLIRDVMVGKPAETGPPSGTEAFSPEEAPAPAGVAPEENAGASPTAPVNSPPSSLAPDVMTQPGSAPAPPGASTAAPSVPEKAKPDDAASDKQSTNDQNAAMTEAATPNSNPVDAPENVVVQGGEPAKPESTTPVSTPTSTPPSESAMPDANVGGEAFGAVEPLKDQAVSAKNASSETTTAIAETLPLHGNLDSAAATVYAQAPQAQPQVESAKPATPTASQEETIDSAGAEPTITAAAADTVAPVIPDSPTITAPHESIEFDSASAQTETVMDTASAAPEASASQSTSAEAKAHFGENVSLNLPPGSILGEVEKDETVTEDGVMVIDNDEAVEMKQTIAYQELPTDSGKTRVLVGAKFPVVMSSEVTSKTAKRGDVIEARLKYDLKIGDRVIAKKGDVVFGHLNYTLKARSTMHSLLSLDRWYRNSGCLGVAFDEIVNLEGAHFPLVAAPSQTARIIKNKGEGRVLGVNHAGQITGPWSQQLRYKAIRVGLNAAMAPAGVFSFGAMPVALGCIGAVNPSFAFMKPVGLNVRHRRIKGFAWGFLSGIPGSFLIEDTVIKGQEAVIKPGDEFLAEFRQEFTGEPVTDASLMAGASTKVHGQVVATKDEPKAASKQAPKPRTSQKPAPTGKPN